MTKTVGSRVDWLAEADRTSPWADVHAVVAGLGRSGVAAADALLDLGAQVTGIDGADTPALHERAHLLETLGATVRLGAGTLDAVPDDTDLVIASPGLPPRTPLLAQAVAAGVPVWGDIELAWRLSHPDRVVPWLAVTGTNGKTTTVTMLASILEHAGLTVATVGNIGRPVLEALADGVDYDVYAVELSSFQLHWTHTLSAHSAAILNIAEDHLEWSSGAADPMASSSGSRPPTPLSSAAPRASSRSASFAAYVADKARIYERVQHSCVYNVEDPVTERLVEEADVVAGARAIGFTTGIPALSMLGVVDGLLVDRAFIPQRRDSALPLIGIDALASPAPHVVANALAAAALARSYGVSATAVREGLAAYRLGGHRIEKVATIGGVTWVDDSKATNPAAAHASLSAFDPVVWIAGGQAKGTSFDDLVIQMRDRLRAAVVFGTDRGVVATALAAQAPDVPVTVVDGTAPETIRDVVARAAAYARPGDTVLLAPGCASLDMFAGYDDRGARFAAAVRGLDAGEVRP